jgi:DNA-binding PadR family transcriptional regulator
MTHLYAIQREILEFLDDRASAETTAIRRQLTYTSDVTITYDALEPHLEELESRGHVETAGVDSAGTTYYRLGDAPQVATPRTASD